MRVFRFLRKREPKHVEDKCQYGEVIVEEKERIIESNDQMKNIK